MKILKFTEDLIPMILSKGKRVTWRLFDEKDLKEGDEIMLISPSRQQFAEAIITEVKEKTFKELTEEENRERAYYRNQKQTFEDFSRYYHTEVTPDTKLKIIKFELKKTNV